MSDETKMLRRALEELQNAMANLWDYEAARPIPTLLREQCKDANEHASFALRVTSETLPPGYSIDDKDVASGRIHPRLNGEFIMLGLAPKYTYDEFKARLFCWEHHLSTGSESQS